MHCSEMNTVKCRNFRTVDKKKINNFQVSSMSCYVEHCGRTKFCFTLQNRSTRKIPVSVKFATIVSLRYETIWQRLCFMIYISSFMYHQSQIMYQAMLCSQKCRGYSTIINAISVAKMAQQQFQYICVIYRCSKMQQSPVTSRI